MYMKIIKNLSGTLFKTVSKKYIPHMILFVQWVYIYQKIKHFIHISANIKAQIDCLDKKYCCILNILDKYKIIDGAISINDSCKDRRNNQ